MLNSLNLKRGFYEFKIMNKEKIKIIHVVGARPNFIKIAPIYKELQQYKFIKNMEQNK